MQCRRPTHAYEVITVQTYNQTSGDMTHGHYKIHDSKKLKEHDQHHLWYMCVCGHSQVQLLEDMHNCTSLKSLMFKKQLTLLAMSLTQHWHLLRDNIQ